MPSAPAPQTPRRLLPAASISLDRALSRRAAIGWPHPRWFTVPLERAFALGELRSPLVRPLSAALALRRPGATVEGVYVAAPVTLVEMTGFVIKHFVGRARPPIADPSQPGNRYRSR